MSSLTPIVFLIFRRPELTARVFEAIRKAQPRQLLVVADGPRNLKEAELCQQTRAITEQIDWDCEVLRNYSEANLGCRNRVSSGITWAFEQVEEAIILEDDCLPTPSFFQYCQVLLERYRYDERITMISGSNYQQGKSRTTYSYYFSKYMHIWGWATWRRAWKNYDVDVKAWPECKAQNLLEVMSSDPYERQYWQKCFDSVYAGEIDTWDYQWVFNCWAQRGLSVIPNVSLVSNIGFGVGATHTTKDSAYANLPTQDIWQITHPPYIFPNYEADRYTFDNHFEGKKMRDDYRLVNRVKNRLKPSLARLNRG